MFLCVLFKGEHGAGRVAQAICPAQGPAHGSSPSLSPGSFVLVRTEEKAVNRWAHSTSGGPGRVFGRGGTGSDWLSKASLSCRTRKDALKPSNPEPRGSGS